MWMSLSIWSTVVASSIAATTTVTTEPVSAQRFQHATDATVAVENQKPPLQRTARLDVEGVSLGSALLELDEKSGVSLIYSPSRLPKHPVTCHCRTLSVAEALSRLLMGTGMRYTIYGEHIIIEPGPTGRRAEPATQLAAAASPFVLSSLMTGLDRLEYRVVPTAPAVVGTIVGRVIDGQTGIPIVAAQVRVEGTEIVALTQPGGVFSLGNVPAGTHTVVAERIGYSSSSVPVTVLDGQTVNIEIVLNIAAIGLEEIVAVGYGQTQRVNLTGAVGTVTPTQIQSRPVARVTEALQGMTPGLTIIQRSAQPGRQDIQFDIRGRNSINTSTTPLIIIDDVPVGTGELNQLNPNDIESISVLKDASSAAIYGSRAANGVILITTRRGAASGRLQISYDGYYGVQDVATFPEILGPREYLELINEARVNAGLQPTYSEEYIANTERALRGEPGYSQYDYPWTDWLDVIFDPAPMHEHTFAVRGGNEYVRFNASLNYLNHQGMTPLVGADRVGLRINTDMTLTERLTGALDLSLRRSTDSEPQNQGQVLFRMFHDTPPTVVPKYPDGTYGWSPNRHNPLAYAEDSGRNDRMFLNGMATARLDYELFPGLSIRSLASVGVGVDKNRTFRNQAVYRDYNNPSVIIRSVNTNQIQHSMAESRNITLRVMGTYGAALGPHSVSLVAGYEQNQSDNSNVSASRQSTYSNDLQEVSAGDASLQTTGGSSGASRLRSVFGRFSYNFGDRYLFEANARYDGSSRFAKGNRFGFFPSFSVGWRISEESFFPETNVLNELKLRASWGRTGNQNIGNYEHWQTVSFTGNYVFGGSLQQGAAITSLANPDISWETTTMRNFGVDAVLFGGKLSFTGDAYRNLTEGLLLSMVMPRTLGLGNTVRENAGKLENRGWELGLAWRDQWGDLGYNIGLNLYDNRNMVLDLAGNPPNISGRSLTAEGYPLGTMWGYEAIGLFRDEADVASHADQSGISPDFGPGDIKFRDLNGDGVIRPEDDRTVIGNELPRYTIGSTIGLNWRGFDLSLFLQGVLQVDAYIEGALTEGPVWENFTTREWLDRWTPENPNPNAKRPKPALQKHHNHGQVSSFWVQDVSYIKLKNAQIGYTFRRSPSTDEPLAQRSVFNRIASYLPVLNFQQMRVYVSGQNLLSFTNDALFLDPEFPSGRGTVYPQTRTISVGTSIQF